MPNLPPAPPVVHDRAEIRTRTNVVPASVSWPWFLILAMHQNRLYIPPSPAASDSPSSALGTNSIPGHRVHAQIWTSSCPPRLPFPASLGRISINSPSSTKSQTRITGLPLTYSCRIYVTSQLDRWNRFQELQEETAVLWIILPHLSEAITLSHDYWERCSETPSLCHPTSAFQ